MPDFSKLFSFIPDTIKAFSSFVPTNDNHRFNIICDILGVVAGICYSYIVLSGLSAAKLEGYQLTLEFLNRVDIAWILFIVFAVICWATTLFKK
ncbi:MAG: hypothetical protein ACRCYW_16575 [Aeromonas sp.]|uniref:hypothetical protein n=1 Tax=Aeromonas sp. TaxID=647 RepID=UPI003F37ADAB